MDRVYNRIMTSRFSRYFHISILVLLVFLFPNDKALAAVGETWTRATGASGAGWSGRYGHTSLVFDDTNDAVENPKMWVLGGYDGDYKNDIWSSTDGSNWTRVTTSGPMWSPRMMHSSVVFQGKMWIIGGDDGSDFNSQKKDVWYSSNGINWTQAATPPWIGRSEHASLVFADPNDNNTEKIWVLLGRKSWNSFVNDIWSSPDGVTWTKVDENFAGGLTQIDQGRGIYSATTFNGEVYIIEGEYPSPFGGIWYAQTTWRSSDMRSWSRLYPLSGLGVSGQTSLVFDNKLWVIGGGPGSPNGLSKVWNLSSNRQAWNQVTASAPWSGRWRHTSLVFDDKMWVLGGYSGGTYKNDVWYSGATAPVVTVRTDDATGVSPSQATLNGFLEAGGLTGFLNSFEYGTDQNDLGTSVATDLGGIGGSFRFPLTGLSSGTQYFFKAVSVRQGVSRVGDVESFWTVPAVPTGVAITPGNGAMKITWPSITGATHYRVIRSTADGSNNGIVCGYTRDITPSGEEAAGITINPGTGTVTCEDIISNAGGDGKTYSYTVQSRNSSGYSAASALVSGVSTIQPPYAPINLTATPASGQISLSWVPGPNGSYAYDTYHGAPYSYKIYRGTTADFSTSSLTPIFRTTTNYIDTTISNDIDYYYKIAAYTGDSNTLGATSPYIISGPVKYVTPAPNAPTALMVTPGNSQVSLSWTVPSGIVDGYKVYTSSNSGGPFSQVLSSNIVLTPITGRDAISAVISSLANGAPIYIKVLAHNSAGDGAAVVSTSAVTPMASPGQPTNITGSQTVATTIRNTVSWSAPVSDSTNSPTSYNVYRGVTSDFAVSSQTRINATAITGTTYIDSGAPNRTNYYKVTAVNVGGESSASSAVEILPPRPYMPNTDTNSITPGRNKITITWTPPNPYSPSGVLGGPVDGYKVFRSTTAPGNGYNLPSDKVLVSPTSGLSSTVHQFEDTTVRNGVLYYYNVVASNFRGDSSGSWIVSATPVSAAPNTPTFRGIKFGYDSQVLISWIPPAVDNAHDAASGYYLYRGDGSSLDPDIDNKQIANITNGNTTYYIDELPGAGEYHYKIVAYNLGGSSAPVLLYNDPSISRSRTLGTPATMSISGYRWQNDAPFGTDPFMGGGSLSGHTATVYNDKIWVIGGESGGNPSKTVWSYSSLGQWENKTAGVPWEGRANHAAVVYQNKLFILGGWGYVGSRYKNDVWSFDGSTWAQLTASAEWSGRSGLAAVAYNNKIWIFGGYGSDGNKNDVWSSTDGVTWMRETDAPWQARSGAQALVYDGKVWLIGGSPYYRDTLWLFDGTSWEPSISNPWSYRLGHGLAVKDEKLWLMGGADGTNSTDLWYYSSQDGWKRGTNYREQGGTLVAFNNELVSLGGFATSDGRYEHGVWRFSLVAPSVVTNDPMGVTHNSAVLQGYIQNTAGYDNFVKSFRYWPNSNSGSFIDVGPDKGGTQSASFSSTIDNLQPNTAYSYKARMLVFTPQSPDGVLYEGDVKSFTTRFAPSQDEPLSNDARPDSLWIETYEYISAGNAIKLRFGRQYNNTGKSSGYPDSFKVIRSTSPIDMDSSISSLVSAPTCTPTTKTVCSPYSGVTNGFDPRREPDDGVRIEALDRLITQGTQYYYSLLSFLVDDTTTVKTYGNFSDANQVGILADVEGPKGQPGDIKLKQNPNPSGSQSALSIASQIAAVGSLGDFVESVTNAIGSFFEGLFSNIFGVAEAFHDPSFDPTMRIEFSNPTSGEQPTSYLVYRQGLSPITALDDPRATCSSDVLLSTRLCLVANVPFSASGEYAVLDNTIYPETHFYYTVVSVFSSGTSGFSRQISGFVPDHPDTPSGLRAVANTQGVNLSWNSSNGAAYYKVYRGTSPSLVPSSSNLVSNNLLVTSFSDTSVVPDTRYYYIVVASNDSGSSLSSNVADATSLLPPVITITNSQDPAAQTVIAGTQRFTFANYQLDASRSGEDVKFTTLKGNLLSARGAASDLTACGLYDGNTALTRGSNEVNPLPSDVITSAKTYTFTLDNDLVVTRGTTKTLSLKCNISASTAPGVSFSWGLPANTNQSTGTGVTSSYPVVPSSSAASAGQSMTVISGGTLSVSLDLVNSPALRDVPVGSTNVSMATLKIMANHEDISLQKLGFKLTSGSPGDIVSAGVYDGPSKMDDFTFANDSYYATSTFNPPINLTKGVNKLLYIKADLTRQPVTLNNIVAINWNGSDPEGSTGAGLTSGTSIRSSGITTAALGVRLVAADNPLPTLTSISPTEVLTPTPTTLNLTGTSFVSGAKVKIGTTEYTATFNSATSLSVPMVPPSTPGTYQVSVVNPAPGGGESGMKELTVKAFVTLPVLPTPLGPVSPQDAAAIDSSFDSVFAPLSNMTISEFNSSARDYTANLRNAQPKDVGSIKLSFPQSSLYSDSSCSMLIGNCAGLNTANPSFGFATLSGVDMASTYFRRAISKLPSGIRLVSSYMFYLEVTAPVSIDSTRTFVNVTKSPIGVRLTLNDLSGVDWRNAALYQYNYSSGAFVRISSFVSPVNGVLTLNGMTIRQDLGYLFAVFGR